jgi:hypothetical protein
VTDYWPRPVRAGPHTRILSAALTAARDFLLDPLEPADTFLTAAPGRRPVVSVFGLARGCGSTVVSRALAVELAARDAGGASAVTCEARASAIPLATHEASRLARALDGVPGRVRAVGRLCLVAGAEPAALVEGVRGLSPLVIDAGATVLGGVPACVADSTVLVTTPALEPALARVAAECVARVGPEPILVVNRAREGVVIPAAEAVTNPAGEGGDEAGVVNPAGEGGAESGGATGRASPRPLLLPESRMGAHLALGGREARGELGRAIAALADRCEGRPV